MSSPVMLRKFDSGVKVIQTKTHSDEEVSCCTNLDAILVHTKWPLNHILQPISIDSVSGLYCQPLFYALFYNVPFATSIVFS